jgi:hypothetical protein
MKRSSLVTAALPRGNYTRFPILPFGHSFTFQTLDQRTVPDVGAGISPVKMKPECSLSNPWVRKLFLPADSITFIPATVLCEFDQWTGARNSREIREQLRCCDWIRLPMSQSFACAGGEGGKKVGQLRVEG